MKKKFYLISFDISSDKRRRKVVKLLENNGFRVQKSVFECLLSDKIFLELKSKLDTEIDHNTDSIRYYNLCKMCKEEIQITGKGIYHDVEDIIVF